MLFYRPEVNIVRRLTGYSLFCIALGMLITLFIESKVCIVILIGVLLLIGYQLFCCSWLNKKRSWKFSFFLFSENELCTLNFSWLQTSSANIHCLGSSVNLATNRLDVWLEHSVWSSMRMAHIVSEMSAFSTYCTLCHDLHLLVWFPKVVWSNILQTHTRTFYQIQICNARIIWKKLQNNQIYVYFFLWMV